MFCHKCGKQNENTRFCRYCGAELLSAEELTANTQPTDVNGSPATMSTPPAEPIVNELPTEPVMSEPSAEPVMSEPSAEPFMSTPPTEPYMGVPPAESFMTPPPAVQMIGAQPEARPPKKRKTGLIIGIIAAILVVLVGVAVVMFFTMTYPAEGQWYNEERGEVLVFGEDGTVSVVSFLGTEDESFSYSRLKGEGNLSIGKTSYDFEADDQEMTIDGLGTYWKADDGFSTSDFLDEYGKLGTWYCEERGEVLVFNVEGTLQRVRLSGSQDSNYEYGYEDGSGTLMFGDTSYKFSLGDGQIDIADIGIYTQADAEFVSSDFINEYGQLGTWYCEERGEVLVFNMDGTMKSQHVSSTNVATFEYDREANTVTMAIGPFAYSGSIEDGQFITENMGTFIQAEDIFDEDVFFEDFGNSILGIWYDPEGELTIDLHADGTYSAFSYGASLEGTYTKQSSGVTITYSVFEIDYEEDYTLVDGELIKDDPDVKNAADTLVREVMEQLGEDDSYSAVIGTWVPLYGNGTLKFTDDTHVTLIVGDSYSGTYAYDPFTGVGYIYMLGDSEVFVTDGEFLAFLEVVFYKT